MKLDRSLFPWGWWGTSLDNVGLQDQRPDVGTYGRYEYANLPDLPIPLDGEFGWLVHASAHQNHIGVERALENIKNLSSLLDACKTAAISLPQSFLKFVQEPRLQARIRRRRIAFLTFPKRLSCPLLELGCWCGFWRTRKVVSSGICMFRLVLLIMPLCPVQISMIRAERR
jgi:hypothetical protein